MYKWDEAKRAVALRKHGVDFADIARFDWTRAVTARDMRHDYSEPRFVSFGPIDGRLHACAWTVRKTGIRIIMLRKANAREVARYGQKV